MQTPIETERKFLIEYPSAACMAAFQKGRVMHFEQTYLLADGGITRRVRKVIEQDTVSYIYTEKRRISALSSFENECAVSEEEYIALLRDADPDRRTIEKARYTLPYGERKLELDIYPFWNDRAILEIELQSENETVILPDYIKVLHDVTEDVRYKNVNLAKTIVFDPIGTEKR